MVPPPASMRHKANGGGTNIVPLASRHAAPPRSVRGHRFVGPAAEL